MTDPQETGRSPESTPEFQQLLKRILSAVEKDRRRGGLELVLMIILSLTALGSTWCAYQSQLWNGQQLALLSDADASTQDAHGFSLQAMQHHMLDAIVMLHFGEATLRDDTKLAGAIRSRMGSPLREAVEAWLKLDPFNNLEATPALKMPQYVLPELAQARSANETALRIRAQANTAGNHGDTYVLLSLMFASVLFFGGITGTFESRRVRTALATIAVLMFLVTLIRVATMPVCAG